MENLNVIDADVEIHVVCLTRSVESIVWSFANRMDFLNFGFTWLFTLDPRYPRNIVNRAPFEQYGMFGMCLWYVIEMLARAAYYRQTLRDIPNLHFHDASLESITTSDGAARLLKGIGWNPESAALKVPVRKKNELKHVLLTDKDRTTIRQMVARFKFDPDSLAGQYIASRRSLG
jgi:hypothetical protein